MKKMLALLSSFVLASSSTLPVISCAENNQSSVENVVPEDGWPSLRDDMLPIWQKFYNQTQLNISISVGHIIDKYSADYVDLYWKYKGTNGSDVPNGVDQYGVPNDELKKEFSKLAVSNEMYEYQMYSLRLYYIELCISLIKNNGQIMMSKNELMNLWGMHYYRSYPFYQWGKIYIWGTNPLILYESPINYDFYEFSGYIPKNKESNSFEWDKSPFERGSTDPDKKFKPQLKLRKEYYEIADEIYYKLFPKAKND